LALLGARRIVRAGQAVGVMSVVLLAGLALYGAYLGVWRGAEVLAGVAAVMVVYTLAFPTWVVKKMLGAKPCRSCGTLLNRDETACPKCRTVR